jgi:hypothetical protein
MKKIFSFMKAIYYYLKCSYKIWRIRRLCEDDVVYTTRENIEIRVYRGKKPESPYDFIVRFKEPNKRERTPAHVHLIVEMLCQTRI